MVAGKSSTVMSGRRNKRYCATKPAPAFDTAMKRHSSNNVKMLKIAASDTKHTMKLSARERKSVASIRLGNPKEIKPRCAPCFGLESAFDSFERLERIEPKDINGIRVTNRKSTLNANMKTVASHGPM